MNQLLHVAQKDFLRYRPLVALALACLVGAPLATYYGFAVGKLGPIPGSFLVEIIKWPLVLLLALAVMQDDSAIGFRSFWLTRPIRPLALLGGKLLLLTGVIAVPGGVAAAVLAWAIDAGAVTSLAVGLEVAITLEVALVAAALVGALSKDVVHAGRNLFILLIGWWLIGMSISVFSPDIQLMPAARPGIALGSQMLFGMSVFTAAALAVLVWIYRRRRLVPATIAALVALIGAVYAGRLCPFQLAPQPVMPPRKPSSPAVLPTIVLSTSNAGLLNGAVWGYVAGQGRVRHDYVAVDAVTATPTSAVLTEIISVTSELTQADGTVHRFPGVPFHRSWAFDNLEHSIRAALVLPPRPAPATPRPRPLRLFSLPVHDNPAPPDRPALLRTALELRHMRFTVEARMPLRAGATARRGGELWRVDKVELAADGNVEIRARRMQATSLLHPVGKARPDELVFSARNVIGYVLYNARRQEYALGFEGKVARAEFAVITKQDVLQRAFQHKFGPAGRVDPGFDDAWLAEAELLVMGAEEIGTSRQELTIPEFVVLRD